MSMEKRILIAFVVSAVIFAVWSILFPPPKRVSPSTQPEQTSIEEKVRDTESPATQEPEKTPEETEDVDETIEAVAPVVGAEVTVLQKSNDVMDLSFNSRGALIERLVLKKYKDAEGNPLDLVQTVEDSQRTWPLQMVIDGTPDSEIFVVEDHGNEVVFRWADGQGRSIVKTVTIPEEGYGIEVSVVTTGFNGHERLSLGAGMRDTNPEERANRFATWGDVTVAGPDDREKFRREKVKENVSVEGSEIVFAGFEDTYFLNVFRVSSGVDGVDITVLEVPGVDDKGEPVDMPVLRVDLRSTSGVFKGELFAAPKEYDLLQEEDRGLEDTLHFGIFHPIAVVFLMVLRWIHGFVGNWGWSIVILTIAIRMALFPLMHKSTVSMRRMQKIQPKVKAIQEKYRKNKSDPQVRQKMNQETMELYKKEGVNPVGGCLPTLVQMPILFALYTLFAHAIELRQAPFIWWITDLSLKDPLYITPILMTATMWLQQRLAPQAGDPNQMRMMRMMPLVFGIMFLGFPSGLVLYWLTNNVVSILQQEVTLHLVGERKRGGGSKRSSGGKKQ